MDLLPTGKHWLVHCVGKSKNSCKILLSAISRMKVLPTLRFWKKKNFIGKIAKCWNWTIFFKYFTKVHKIELVTLISGFFSWNWNSQNLWGHFWVIIQPNRFSHLSFCKKFTHKAQFCTKFAEKRVRVRSNYKNDQNWWVVPKIGWYTMQHFCGT